MSALMRTLLYTYKENLGLTLGGIKLQYYSECVVARDITVVLYIHGILDVYTQHAVQLTIWGGGGGIVPREKLSFF